MVCRKYLHIATLNGADYEDIFQAGMAALFKAVKDFDESRGMELSTFAIPAVWREAWRCIQRQNGNPKNTHLNAIAARLDAPVNDAANAATLNDLLDGVCMSDETILEVEEFIRILSDREQVILTARMQGMTMERIGERIGLTRGRVCQLLAKIRARYECYQR